MISLKRESSLKVIFPLTIFLKKKRIYKSFFMSIFIVDEKEKYICL